MEETNNKQNIAIERLNTEMAEVKDQVKNHLPTQIKDLSGRICDLKKAFNSYQLSQSKFMTGILVSIVILLIGVITNIVISLVH